eukprot:5459059-Amphidinium_carterae.1
MQATAGVPILLSACICSLNLTMGRERHGHREPSIRKCTMASDELLCQNYRIGLLYTQPGMNSCMNHPVLMSVVGVTKRKQIMKDDNRSYRAANLPKAQKR